MSVYAIDAITRSIKARFASRRVPCVVVYGREPAERQAITDNRVIIVEAPDKFGPPLGAGGNPHNVFSRYAGFRAEILGLCPAAGATAREHRATVNGLLHELLLAARRWTSANGSTLELSGGQFIDADAAVEVGARYELTGYVGEGIPEVPWTEVTVEPSGSAEIVINGTPTTACGETPP